MPFRREWELANSCGDDTHTKTESELREKQLWARWKSFQASTAGKYAASRFGHDVDTWKIRHQTEDGGDLSERDIFRKTWAEATGMHEGVWLEPVQRELTNCLKHRHASGRHWPGHIQWSTDATLATDVGSVELVRGTSQGV